MISTLRYLKYRIHINGSPLWTSLIRDYTISSVNTISQSAIYLNLPSDKYHYPIWHSSKSSLKIITLKHLTIMMFIYVVNTRKTTTVYRVYYILSLLRHQGIYSIQTYMHLILYHPTCDMDIRLTIQYHTYDMLSI